MPEPHTAPDIPLAQAGPISDEALRQIQIIGAQLQSGSNITEAEVLLLVQCSGPIAEECLKRRQAMRVVHDCTGDLSNVTFLEDRRDV
ncbi:hypothetical protein [Marinovum algicola]|uniref:hypothetical protein n=1 Tax=Marinovum algicola TaxID=42444 RepID=UPI003B51B9CE